MFKWLFAGAKGKSRTVISNNLEGPERPSVCVKNSPIYTLVPSRSAIPLIAYYNEFISYYPSCEMQTKGWCVRNIKQDWTILDCGANIGYYSILFSQLASSGRVYAIEPTDTFDMLIQNLEFNKSENVIPVRVALGESSGHRKEAVFRIWGKAPEVKEYEFLTIDDLVARDDIPRVDCIKIDVDSFDFDVLKGAVKTMQRDDPYIVVELNHALSRRNQSNAEALHWLSRMGYGHCVVLDYENFVLKRGDQVSQQIDSTITLEFVSERNLQECNDIARK